MTRYKQLFAAAMLAGVSSLAAAGIASAADARCEAYRSAADRTECESTLELNAKAQEPTSWTTTTTMVPGAGPVSTYERRAETTTTASSRDTVVKQKSTVSSADGTQVRERSSTVTRER
jgi:hypothetical protein